MDTRSLDRLGDEIAELSAHLDAATARLLELIREFDAREGWNTGFRSCAHWLSWRIGLDLGAARERVRVARALHVLPRIVGALASGEISYAKVRAVTRVATAETALHHGVDPGTPGERYQVVIHVDAPVTHRWSDYSSPRKARCWRQAKRASNSDREVRCADFSALASEASCGCREPSLAKCSS